MRKEDPKFIEKRKKFYAEQKEKSQDKFSKGGLSPKQKVIAAKAPPPNKITGADFAAMKKEKVMKAKQGDFMERRMKLMGINSINPKVGEGSKPSYGKFEKLGKVMKSRAALLGAVGAGAATGLNMAGRKLKKVLDERKARKRDTAKVKKMGGGMMQKPMGYDDGGATYEKPFLKLKPRVRNARGQNPDRPRGPARPAASGPKKTEDFSNNSKFKKYNVSGSDGSTLIISLKDAGKKLSGLTPLGGAASAIKKYRDFKDDQKSRNPNPKTPKMYGGGSVSVKTKLGRNKPTKLY